MTTKEPTPAPARYSCDCGMRDVFDYALSSVLFDGSCTECGKAIKPHREKKLRPIDSPPPPPKKRQTQ